MSLKELCLYLCHVYIFERIVQHLPIKLRSTCFFYQMTTSFKDENKVWPDTVWRQFWSNDMYCECAWNLYNCMPGFIVNTCTRKSCGTLRKKWSQNVLENVLENGATYVPWIGSSAGAVLAPLFFLGLCKSKGVHNFYETVCIAVIGLNRLTWINLAHHHYNYMLFWWS